MDAEFGEAHRAETLLTYCPAMLSLRFCAACLLAALPAMAQPNSFGIALTHVQLNSANPDAAIAFWKDVIGMSTYTRGSMTGVSTQGGLILFTAKAPLGASAGSAIDHIGLRVPELQPLIARLAKTSYKGFQPTPGGDTLMIDGPDGVRIELTEDSTMYSPLEFGHIHVHSAEPKETQAWYGKYFGGRPGTDDQAQSSRVPGGTLTFTSADAALPSAGRAIDHVSFEVKDLKGFCKTLAESGIKLEPPVDSVVYLTDPWGTRIALTEAPAR